MKTDQTFFPAFQIFMDNTTPQPYLLSTPVSIPPDFIMYVSVVEGTFVAPATTTGGRVGQTLQFAIIPSTPDGTGSFYESELAYPSAHVVSRTIPAGNYSNFEIAEYFSFTGVDPFDPNFYYNVQLEYLPQPDRFLLYFSTTSYGTPLPLHQATPFRFIRLVQTQLSSSLGFTATPVAGVYPTSNYLYSGDPYFLIPIREELVGVSSPLTTDSTTINNIYVNTSLTPRIGDSKVAKVLVDTLPIVHFINRNDFAVQIYDKSINNLELWLTDESGNLLNIPYSLTLQFDVCMPPEKPYVPQKPTPEITGAEHIKYVLAQDPIPVFVVPIPSADADHPDSQALPTEGIPDSGTAPANRLPTDDNSFM